MRQSFSSGCKRGWLSSGEDASGMKIVLTSVEMCPEVWYPKQGHFSIKGAVLVTEPKGTSQGYRQVSGIA